MSIVIKKIKINKLGKERNLVQTNINGVKNWFVRKENEKGEGDWLGTEV